VYNTGDTSIADCRYRKILGNTGYTSIVDTGIFWKYWLYQYCRYWKILENTDYTSIYLQDSVKSKYIAICSEDLLFSGFLMLCSLF
jgi:hypothetical protein